jgi:hypothetical protein
MLLYEKSPFWCNTFYHTHHDGSEGSASNLSHGNEALLNHGQMYVSTKTNNIKEFGNNTVPFPTRI